MVDYVRVQEFVAHSTRVNCLAVGPNSNQVLATGGEDTKVNIWRVGSVENIWTLGYNKSPVECVCFDSGEQCVVSGAMNGSIKVYDLNEGKLARNLGSHQVSVKTMQYHPYGEFLVTGSADCTMKFWDLRAKTCVETYTGHKKELTCVRFSPDGKWVASAAKDGQLIIYDLVATKHVDTIRTLPAYITRFEFNPLELAVVASTSARYVRYWDLDSMQVLATTPAESTAVSALAVPDSGSSLYTSTKNGVKIWDLDTFRLRDTIDIGWSPGAIADMRVADDDQIVAASFQANFVSVWQVDVAQALEAQAQQSETQDVRDTTLAPVSAPAPALAVASAAAPKQQLPSRQQQMQGMMEKLEQVKLMAQGLPAAVSAAAAAAPAPAQSKATPYDSGADSKAVPSRGARNLYREPVSTAAKDEDDYLNEANSDFSDSDAKDAPGGHRYQEHGRRPSDPQVVVDGAMPPINMAASLGESFWNKLARQQQQQHDPQSVTALRREIDAEMNGDGDDDDNEMNFADEQLEVPFDELDDLLPPPAYDKQPHQPAPQSHQQAKADVGAKAVPASSRPQQQQQQQHRANPPQQRDVAPPPSVAVRGGAARHAPAGAAGEKSIPVEVFAPAPHPGGLAAAGKAIRLQSPEPATPPQSKAVDLGLVPPPTASGSDAARCHELVDRMSSANASTMSALSQRLVTLKLLRQTWNKGDVQAVLEHLEVLATAMVLDNPQNVSIIVDFLVGVDLKGHFLSLNACVQLLPIIDSVLTFTSSRTQPTDIAAFVCYSSLVDLAHGFGELIRNTRSVMVAGGVDLSREERLQKCNTCYQIFHKAKQRLDIVRHQNRHHARVLPVLEQYQRLANHFFP